MPVPLSEACAELPLPSSSVRVAFFTPTDWGLNDTARVQEFDVGPQPVAVPSLKSATSGPEMVAVSTVPPPVTEIAKDVAFAPPCVTSLPKSYDDGWILMVAAAASIDAVAKPRNAVCRVIASRLPRGGSAPGPRQSYSQRRAWCHQTPWS